MKGILIPLYSLPSKCHIGGFCSFNDETFALLKDKGFDYLELAPITYCNKTHNPYAWVSNKAILPLYMDIAGLGKFNYLEDFEISSLPNEFSDKVDYKKAFKLKSKLMASAYRKFKENDDYNAFISANDWVDDTCFYLAIYELYRDSWLSWNDPIKNKEIEVTNKVRNSLAKNINYHKFIQYILYKQFAEFRDAANKHHLKLVGIADLKANIHSSDAWLHPEYFETNNNEFSYSKDYEQTYLCEYIKFMSKHYDAIKLINTDCVSKQTLKTIKSLKNITFITDDDKTINIEEALPAKKKLFGNKDFTYSIDRKALKSADFR